MYIYVQLYHVYWFVSRDLYRLELYHPLKNMVSLAQAQVKLVGSILNIPSIHFGGSTI